MSLGELPFFNQEVERTTVPAVVTAFREQLGSADAVLIASPEYAHGTSGVLKNALEWIVGGGQFVGMPVGLVSASTSPTGGDRAQAWLSETLTIMGADLSPGGVRIPHAASKVSGGLLTHDGARREVAGLLAELCASARRPLASESDDELASGEVESRMEQAFPVADPSSPTGNRAAPQGS